MADQRTTDRTELNATPANGDLLDIVDIDDATDNASGTSKKITVTNLLSWIASATQTLTNKTISLTSNTLSGTIAEFNTAITDATLSGNNTGDEVAATDSTAGVVELATEGETSTGTDTGRAVTPDGLAGSNFGIRYVSVLCFDYGTDTATGDGKGYFHIPSGLDGMNLVSVHAEVFTAGTTGTTDIQIHNVDNALDMLSTKLTIDSAETGSDTAATPAVINTSNDHVNTNDVIRIDVDAVSTTAAKGLLVTLGFQTP